MRGVRESRGMSRFSQARSSHCALRRRAEAAPQDKATHGHARRFPEVVCQPAGRTMNGPCQLRQCNRSVEMLADMFAGLGNHRIKACAIAHGLPNQMVYQLLRRDSVAGCVIKRAELRDTELPAGTHVSGPHSQMYEAWFGMIDPPRDYSVYDMSWVGPAASLISTVADLNHFYRLLLAGDIVSRSSLAQMQHTVPVISFEGKRSSTAWACIRWRFLAMARSGVLERCP
jgi:hypothetical protein